MNRRKFLTGTATAVAATAIPVVASANDELVADPNRLVTITIVDNGQLYGTVHPYIKKPHSNKFILNDYYRTATNKFHDRDMLIAHLTKHGRIGKYISAFTNKEAGYKEIRFIG